ncbi:alpha/beta hydrolase [Corynebacterium riegelii]|uniref:alpha/beta hydrolase n=1 Tax=Corynebacterium riegelii TaxID=156976 RepID=UPI0023F3C33B|nr:alpha/beta hydrolase [Corynebacterium riegelii]
MTDLAYAPSLFPTQLRSVASAWRLTARALSARATAVRRAIDALKASGFDGPAPQQAYKRLESYAASYEAAAERAERVADVMTLAAQQQDLIDQAAADALHQRTIVLLNLMSKQLDMAVAKHLNPTVADRMERLVDGVGVGVDTLHAQHMATLPAATQLAIERAGGTVLEAGPGATTVMVGNAVDPARIITMVAGVSSGDPRDLPAELAKAQRIAETTGASVVVWQGYDPPKDLAEGFSGLPATRGAADLSMFQLALEQRWPDATKTVVAHSYGTLVASRAAHQHGLLADDLWLLGSPGVDGQSVADLTLRSPDSAVFVADASDDVILALRNDAFSLHGSTSPSDPSYGATIIDGVRGSHSDYFTDQVLLDALAGGVGEAVGAAVGEAAGAAAGAA